MKIGKDENSVGGVVGGWGFHESVAIWWVRCSPTGNCLQCRKVQTNNQLRPEPGGFSLSTLAPIRDSDNYREPEPEPEPDKALLD